MQFTPVLVEIRERMQLVRRLKPFISFFGAIHSGRVPHDVDRFVKTQFDVIKGIVQDQNTPSNLRIQDAFPPYDDQPSAEWRAWLLGVVESRNVDDRGVDLIGHAFDSAMITVQQVLTQLPPQVRDELGPDIPWRLEYWVAKAHLRKEYSLDEVDSELRRAIDSAWRPVEKRCFCTRWGQLKWLLGRPEIVLTWSDTDGIAESIETVLRHHEKAGIKVYEATIDYIVKTAKRLIDELTPDWFPVDGAELDPQVQEELLSSVRPVPVLLKLDMFKWKIRDVLSPLPVTEDRINEALRKMQRDGEWHSLVIQHRTNANAEPLREVFVCAGRGSSSQSSSQRKNERGDPGKADIPAPEGPRDHVPNPSYTFQRSGNTWTLKYDGESGTFTDSKGFNYMYHLVERRVKGNMKPVHVNDLMMIVNSTTPIPAKMQTVSETTGDGDTGDFSRSQDIIDAETRKDLARRALEIRDKPGWESDPALVVEHSEITKHLADSTFHRKPKSFSDDDEKKRVSVKQSIDRAIEKLKKQGMPKLSEHFADQIKTGYQLQYVPPNLPAWTV